jgi:hypothetical protein
MYRCCVQMYLYICDLEATSANDAPLWPICRRNSRRTIYLDATTTSVLRSNVQQMQAVESSSLLLIVFHSWS